MDFGSGYIRFQSLLVFAFCHFAFCCIKYENGHCLRFHFYTIALFACMGDCVSLRLKFQDKISNAVCLAEACTYSKRKLLVQRKSYHSWYNVGVI